MIFVIIIAVVLFCAWLSVCFRLTLLHPLLTLCYSVKDLYFYFYYKKWRICETGKIIAYTALFGKGKTLSVVHYMTEMYRRYNNKKVWDRDRKKWVVQKIHIISNVDLNIPYEKLVSLSQIVACAENNSKKDMLDDTLTITLVLGDEFSVQMNSRNFKSNIDPLFLNTLLTCRHHHITLVYDAQRFGHVDALLRQVTSYVVQCNKVWRFMVLEYYDAWDLENAQNPKMVNPFRRTGWFVCNRDYAAYDTLACVENLSRSCKEGDMLTEEQILALQCNQASDMESVTQPSRKYRRNMKKSRK